MDETESDEIIRGAQKRTQIAARISFGVAVGFPVIYGALLLGLTWPISEFNISKSGLFGDSFGVVTSLITGLAFAGLIWSIFLQKEDLKLTHYEIRKQTKALKDQEQQFKYQNEQLKKQGFENAFFQMLSFHNQITELINISIPNWSSWSPRSGNVKPDPPPTIHKGKTSFKCFYDKFSGEFSEARKKYLEKLELIETKAVEGFDNETYQDEQKRFFEEIDPAYTELDNRQKKEIITAAYNEFQKNNEPYVGHYFANMYNIIKFIDNSETVDNKKEYTNLFRTQLSKYELLLLFYDGLSKYGIEKFKPLIEQYSFLKNTDVKSLCIESDKDLYNEKAFYRNLPKNRECEL